MAPITFLGCWCCGCETLYAIPPTYDSVVTAICKSCGLVQRRTPPEAARERPTKGLYFGRNLRSSLSNVRKRRLYIETLMHVYISMLTRHVALDKISRTLDIGGAEGLFSYLLKQYYPQIDAYSVDPDEACLQYGKRFYPGVNLVLGTAEQHNVSGKYDLITDIGAIYRAVDPYTVIQQYQELLSEDGVLVVCANVLERLHNARTGDSVDSFALFDPPRGEVFQRSFFDQELFERFMSTTFSVDAVENVRIAPLQHKSFSFLICRKRSDISRKAVLKECHWEANLRVVRDYAYKLTVERLRALSEEKGIGTVAILGRTIESVILRQACRAAGIEVFCTIHPNLHEVPDSVCEEENVLDFRAFSDPQFDACLIADYNNQEDLEWVVRFCRLQSRRPVYLGFQYDEWNLPVTIQWADGPALYRGFRFKQILPE